MRGTKPTSCSCLYSEQKNVNTSPLHRVFLDDKTPHGSGAVWFV